MIDALACCVLFSGLKENRLCEALLFFDAREKAYPRGALLNRPGEALARFGLLLSGEARVSMDAIDGRHMIMATVRAGDTFGEALCYLQSETAIYIEAASDCRVLWLSCDGLRAEDASELHALLRARFTAMLARRTLKMNDRIQILSRGGIREKVKAYFSECARDAGANAFSVPLSRADMAAYLGVNRSALSRTLSAMRREGLLEYAGKRFVLHEKA